MNTRKRKASAAFDDEFDYPYGIVTVLDCVDLLANPSELEPNAENAVLVDEIFELKSENAKLRWDHKSTVEDLKRKVRTDSRKWNRNPEARECIE
ncbi:unnamed protein product [Rhizophagus irregularis]|nr:unnamed protein product [Rhizophagus irregularis]